MNINRGTGNKKYILCVLVIVIVLGGCYFIFWQGSTEQEILSKVNPDQNMSTEEDYSPLLKDRMAGEREKGTVVSENKIIAGFIEDSKDDVKKRFKQTRNIVIADPSMSPGARKQYIERLQDYYQQNYGALPEETKEDIDEQKRIAKLIESFKTELQTVKYDSSLSRKEKAEDIRHILEQYVRNLETK